jgi:hypothetical protein
MNAAAITNSDTAVIAFHRVFFCQGVGYKVVTDDFAPLNRLPSTVHRQRVSRFAFRTVFARKFALESHDKS